MVKSGKIIYSRDEIARVEFEARSEREYLDLSRLRERYNEDLLEEVSKWKD